MRRYWIVRMVVCLCLAVALLALAATLFAQQPPTERLVVELDTKVMALPYELPNLPATPAMPTMPTMPGMPAMPGLGGAQLSVSGTASYETDAADPIFVTVPADLGLAENRLVLHLPEPVAAAPPRPPGGQALPPMPGTLTTRLYWHPGTAEGPVENSVDLGMFQPFMGGGMAMPTLPTPLPDDGGSNVARGLEILADPATVGSGEYVLNTGGAATLDGFLPAIEVAEPEILADVDPTDGFQVTWEPVAGARGYILQAMGMTGSMLQQQDMTVIQWVSTVSEPPQRARYGYEQETSIADDLENGILLPADATSCALPPDVFPADLGMFMLTLTAVGNDFYSDADGITVLGKIRSEWTSTLIPQLAAMMNMPGVGEE